MSNQATVSKSADHLELPLLDDDCNAPHIEDIGEDNMSRRAGEENRRQNDDRLADVLERLATNLDTSRKTWAEKYGPSTIAIVVVVIGWAFNSIYVAKSTETDVKVSNAVLYERIDQLTKAFTEYKLEEDRKRDRDNKLLDERYRQLSIALEARGIRLPQQ